MKAEGVLGKGGFHGKILGIGEGGNYPSDGW